MPALPKSTRPATRSSSETNRSRWTIKASRTGFGAIDDQRNNDVVKEDGSVQVIAFE
jgi:hypothetical protein